MKLLIFIGFFLIFYQVQCIWKPVYRCQGNSIRCLFTDIKLNSTHYDWNPVSDDPWAITHVQIKNSTIPVITSNICQKFPNIKKLEIEENQVEQIFEDAFMNCKKLEYIDLGTNNIKTIGKRTFYHNKAVKTLYINNNQITDFNDINIFINMPFLEELSLSRNNLSEFSPDLIRHNKYLKQLWLYSNELLTLDVEKIYELLPELTRFEIDDNQILCSRMVDIVNFFKKNGIKSTNKTGKVRYYPMQKVLGYTCLPDASWMAAHYTVQNTKVMRKVMEK